MIHKGNFLFCYDQNLRIIKGKEGSWKIQTVLPFFFFFEYRYMACTRSNLRSPSQSPEEFPPLSTVKRRCVANRTCCSLEIRVIITKSFLKIFRQRCDFLVVLNRSMGIHFFCDEQVLGNRSFSSTLQSFATGRYWPLAWGRRALVWPFSADVCVINSFFSMFCFLSARANICLPVDFVLCGWAGRGNVAAGTRCACFGRRWHLLYRRVQFHEVTRPDVHSRGHGAADDQRGKS